MDMASIADTVVLVVVLGWAGYVVWRYVKQSLRPTPRSCGACAGCPAHGPHASGQCCSGTEWPDGPKSSVSPSEAHRMES